jgi:hypothetical protein
MLDGMKVLIAVAASAVLVVCGKADANYTQFSYTATPGSWIGDGVTTFLETPDTGWSFGATARTDHSFVSLTAIRTAAADQSGPTDFQLQLQAPSEQVLVPGFYDGATRYPFEPPATPGFTLVGNHREDNSYTGYFKVLEVDFGSGTTVNRFAVEFQMFDNGSPDNWVLGEFLYNSTVPEPGTLAFFGITGALFSLPRRRRVWLVLHANVTQNHPEPEAERR